MDLGLHNEEGNKIHISDLIKATQGRSGCFLYFMVAVHPDQADPKFRHIHMTFRYCVQFPLYLYGIYAINDTQMLKTSHDLLVHLVALGD